MCSNEEETTKGIFFKTRDTIEMNEVDDLHQSG